MEWISSWFYPPVSSPPPKKELSLDHSDVINQTMNSVDALHAKRLHILKKSSDMLKEAKEHKAKGDVKRAMMCMKRKQQLDGIATQLEGQMLNLEKTSLMMDSTATTVDLAHTMRDGSTVIRNLLSEVSLDDIDQVADDLDDSMRDATELGNALARPLGGDVVDEEELNADIVKQMAEWEEEPTKEWVLPDVPLRNDNNNGGGGTGLLAKEPVPLEIPEK